MLVHTDASQSCGKVPVDVDAMGVDLLTVNIGPSHPAMHGALRAEVLSALRALWSEKIGGVL